MAITLNGTTGITTPGVANSGNETVTGSLTVTGAIQGSGISTNLYPIVSGTAVASTSGTSIDFTSIPSWVKRITVMFDGVSTNGTSGFRLRLGYGSTPTYITTGYNSNGVYVTSATPAQASTTDGFFTGMTTAASQTNWGAFVITNISGNNWTYTSVFSSNNNVCGWAAGNLNMSSNVLTAIRITTAGGTDTFDAGSINILYE